MSHGPRRQLVPIAAEVVSVKIWFAALNLTLKVLCQKGAQVVPQPTVPVSLARN